MPFCTKCGTKLHDSCKFCIKCGAPVKAAVPAAPLYQGTEYTFPLLGEVLTVSPQMDAFNYYRKEFRRLARVQANALAREYRVKIYDLDSFLVLFPAMYARFRKPLIHAAMDLLESCDLSVEQFEEQHTADFCLCARDADVIIESFKLTIEANQKGEGDMISGLGGFADALAVNQITEADIRNTNVTKKQRAELYSRINFNSLMERAYTDYWRVFLSAIWRMNQKGLDVWYPNAQDNQRASGLYQNLIAGRIPEERVPGQLVLLLQLNPYGDEYLKYVNEKFGITEETGPVFEYFGFEG